MPKFGIKSTTQLHTCERDLQTIAREAIKIIDFSILEGNRSLEKQWEYWLKGRGIANPGLDPENSASYKIVNRADVITGIDGKDKKGMHNYSPSKAYDIAPYPIDFRNKEKVKARFYYLGGVMLAVAERLFEDGTVTHKLRWGGDWDFDHNFEDQTFDDLPHYELYKPKR